eukprot:4963731-Karenia_brevis.AAC.1
MNGTTGMLQMDQERIGKVMTSRMDQEMIGKVMESHLVLSLHQIISRAASSGRRARAKDGLVTGLAQM